MARCCDGVGASCWRARRASEGPCFPILRASFLRPCHALTSHNRVGRCRRRVRSRDACVDKVKVRRHASHVTLRRARPSRAQWAWPVVPAVPAVPVGQRFLGTRAQWRRPFAAACRPAALAAGQPLAPRSVADAPHVHGRGAGALFHGAVPYLWAPCGHILSVRSTDLSKYLSTNLIANYLAIFGHYGQIISHDYP